jgi:hypothetical protein
MCRPIDTSSAEDLASSLISVLQPQGLETFIGPIIPEKDFGSSFRSELGVGFAASEIGEANLTGSLDGDFPLRSMMSLDVYPYRYSLTANLRWWRFGLRGEFQSFNNSSTNASYGSVDCTGFSVGGDFDLVHLDWLLAGAGVDFELSEPVISGHINTSSKTQNVAPQSITEITLRGDAPVSAGPYVRYVPPEILGWPVHAEALYRFPVAGSSLSFWRVGLVFRPQIYRFDVGANVFYESRKLEFENDPEVLVSDPAGAIPYQTFEFTGQWTLYGFSVNVYF